MDNPRELNRRNGRVDLGDKAASLLPLSKPAFISLNTGYNTSRYLDTEEVRKTLIRYVESLCDKLKADNYEIGESITTWGSDPGFGLRTEHYPIQFYIRRG